MQRKLILFIASIAALFCAVGAAYGFAPVETSTWLNVDVAWLDGFTAHLDTMGGMAALASTATMATKEMMEAAVAELRKGLEKATEEINDKLKKNLKEQIEDLEVRIKKGEEAGQAVADLKEQSAKMSVDNAKFVEEIQGKVKEFADEVNEKVEKIKATSPEAPGGRYNFGGALTAEVQKRADVTSNSAGKLVIVHVEKGWIPRNLKDISVTGATVYPPSYVPGIIGPGERILRIRQLLPVNRTSQRVVFFVRETALTNNAGMQTEGQAKGETTFQIEPASETVRTVAHFIQVPLQMLDDLPALEDYINSRMLYLLMNKEEQQILYGNGQGQELNGIMTQATALDTTILTELDVEAVTNLDRIRAAIAQVQVAEYPPDGIVLHPYQWAGIEMLKDSQERYIFVNPQNQTQSRLWGLPVVPTTQMQQPDFLVGAFALGAALWDRQESSIAISTEDSDNFQKNLATIRAEERLALTVYRTASFVEGDLTGSVT